MREGETIAGDSLFDQGSAQRYKRAPLHKNKCGNFRADPRVNEWNTCGLTGSVGDNASRRPTWLLQRNAACFVGITTERPSTTASP